MAVVGRRFPGMMPRASTRMARSTTVRIMITQDGRLSAREKGHNTDEPLKFQTRGTVPERATVKSYPAARRTKLKP